MDKQTNYYPHALKKHSKILKLVSSVDMEPYLTNKLRFTETWNWVVTQGNN